MRAWVDVSNPRSDLSIAYSVSSKYNKISYGKWGSWFQSLRKLLEQVEAGLGGWELVDESLQDDSTPALHVSKVWDSMLDC